MVIVSGLINFNQYTIATFRMNKNHLTTVCAGRGRIRQELIALGGECCHVFQNIVRAETDMVDAALAVLLEVFGNRSFAVQRVNQLDLRAFDREERGGGFGSVNVFGSVEREAKILQKALDGFFEVRHGNSNMVEMGNHRRLG